MKLYKTLLITLFCGLALSQANNNCIFTGESGEEYNLSVFGGEYEVAERNTNNGLSYKFDLCNPDISCEADPDLVSHNSLVGFLERKQTDTSNLCRKFEEFNDYSFTKVKNSHELTFTSKNACTENHFPKDLQTVFRFTCDYTAPSKNEFMSMKTTTPCTRIFEIVSGEACNMHFNGVFRLDYNSKSYKSLKYVTLAAAMIGSCLYLAFVLFRAKARNEKLKYKAMRHAV
ncbi:unnamed protein product [Moneuplotes crassus]|uniref:MRH domain-containing protein n=1 Tax=Euplotes crassus TaxID=5936 RepID=A0AAD1XU25_EUPCR|nr:unnamed protein product [Moneuplotes crassus]